MRAKMFHVRTLLSESRVKYSSNYQLLEHITISTKIRAKKACPLETVLDPDSVSQVAACVDADYSCI